MKTYAVLIAGSMLLPCTPALQAQTAAALTTATAQQHLRSRIFVYDLRDGSSKLVYTADAQPARCARETAYGEHEEQYRR